MSELDLILRLDFEEGDSFGSSVVIAALIRGILFLRVEELIEPSVRKGGRRRPRTGRDFS